MTDRRTLWVYLPYVDAEAAGMQRFASQMILALARARVPFRLVIGEAHGRPAWLDGLDHRVAIGAATANSLPRAAVAVARVAWLQLVFPRIARAGDTLLALGHELPPLPRIRQVAVVHDLTDFKPYAERGSTATRARNRLWKAGLQRAAAVIAISEATRRDLLDLFGLDPARVTVIHEGVDRALFRPTAATASTRYLLYAGTLDPHKNVPFLLDVFARLKALVPDIRLKLVGRHDPARTATMRGSVPDAIRGDVQFVGFVSDETLAALMAGCAAFVFPSRNEGFGLAPAEAMACGAPVIAAAAGSLPEVVGNGGVLLSPDDAGAWVGELVRLLGDEAYRETLSARALARSDAFSWDAAAAAYAEVITAA